MHPLSFLQKRGHLSAVALGRKMFEGVLYMTPARFDLLHVVYEMMRDLPGNEIWVQQVFVRRRLGLARQTVHKMVLRLVELGFLRKKYDDWELRVCLTLTEEGIERIHRAYGVAFTARYPVPGQKNGSNIPRPVQRLAHDAAEKDRWYYRMFTKGHGNDPAVVARQGFYVDPPPPDKVGREVARVFKAYAFERAGRPKRNQHLRTRDVLRTLIKDARALAKALGDQSTLIYAVPRPERFKPPTRPMAHEAVTCLAHPECAISVA